MIGLEQAKRIAERHIDQLAHAAGTDLVLTQLIGFDRGWVACYATRESIDAGDNAAVAGGGAPLIIDGRDGTVYRTSHAHSTDWFIDNYRRTGNPFGEEESSAA